MGKHTAPEREWPTVDPDVRCLDCYSADNGGCESHCGTCPCCK